MADGFIQLPPNSTGSKMDTRTDATNGFNRQVVVVADPSVTEGIAPVDAIRGLRVNDYVGDAVNVYGSAAIPSSTETALSTYIVPMTKTLLIRGAVGWGDYDGLVAFVDDYCLACRQFPTANVRISR